MMTLVEKIFALYPELTSNDLHPIRGTIGVRNDGQNDYIEKWENTQFPQPTKDQLEQQT